MKRSFRLMTWLAVLASVVPALVARSLANDDPENRLELSRIEIRSLESEDLSFRSASLEDVIPLVPGKREVLEVRFVGAPRWLNQIDFRTDATAWRIEIWSTGRDRAWIPLAGKTQRIGDTIRLDGADTFARGIRLVPLAAPEGKSEVTVELLGAAFQQVDPDDMRDGTIGPLVEEGAKECHVGWSNDYPGTINDLNCSDNDAENLNNDLPSTWTKWLHSDLNNEEVHYKNGSIGNGDNNSHTDAADLSFYVGHGLAGEFFIGNDYSDDAELTAGDAVNSWGNDDMEWLGSPACQWLDAGSRSSWHDAMDGLHLLCGSETNARGSPLYSYGGKWASKMKDSGAFDTAITVKSSWFDAYEAENPAGNVAVVIGETSSQGDDYLWGEGTVSSEPTHDGSYTCWRYTASGLRPWSSIVSDPALGREAPARVDPVHFAPDGGLPVTIERSLLLAPAVQLPYYIVVPAAVDSPTVRALAQEICMTEGVLCGGDIGPGDEDEINLIDGTYGLRVCSNTGSFTYDAQGQWLAWRTEPPALPGPEVAPQLASQKLAAWNRYPQDAVFHSIRYVRQANVSHPNGEEVEDPQTSFPIAIQVVYQRRLGMVPVEGGGGYMSVALGHQGELQRVFQPGWHPVTMGAPVTILPVQDVIQQIANRGSDATVDAITPPALSVVIQAWRLAYYEPPCGVPVQRLRPIYVFNATVTDLHGNESQSEIYAWADRLSPVAGITAPAADSVAVPFGSTLCVQGQSMGGAPPVVLRWKDDLGRDLGTGPSVCFDTALPPVGNHSEGDRIRTITLTARDALGSIGTDRFRIRVLPPVAGVHRDVPVLALLEQNRPNPFATTTKIAFHVPETVRRNRVDLRVFDPAGRLVTTLVDGEFPRGDHEVAWDATGAGGHPVPAGVYFYELKIGTVVETRKLLVTR